MLKDITLGQYFPIDSVLHRLDPRTKLILLVLHIVAIFLADSVVTCLLAAGITLLVLLFSRISLKTYVRGLKPIWFVIIFTAALNMFLTAGIKIELLGYQLPITYEGLALAGKMALRLVLLIFASSALTYTTSPIALTDGIEKLLSPFAKLGLPTFELAMMMSIAIRFIPTLIEETDKIMKAQKARGADFDSGSLIRRVKALAPMLIPLFISAFRRADDLAVAMESRCYRGGNCRTRLNEIHFGRIDLAAVILFLLFFAALIVIRFIV